MGFHDLHVRVVVHCAKSHDEIGRAGSPLPAARSNPKDGAQGTARPTFSYKQIVYHSLVLTKPLETITA